MIEIGYVIREWPEDENNRDELSAYVQVAASLDGKPVKLGVVVGVPDYLQDMSQSLQRCAAILTDMVGQRVRLARCPERPSSRG